MSSVAAVVLAAGRGRRMGADKALLDLGGRTAIERVVQACRAGGVDTVVVVRSVTDPLPVSTTVVTVAPGGEMLDSVRAGLAAIPAEAGAALVFPVDYAMVSGATVRALVDALPGSSSDPSVVLPIFDERPGHPVGLTRPLFAEVERAGSTLRDVVAADPDRVRPVRVDDPWIRRDLDTPDDLEAARREISRED